MQDLIDCQSKTERTNNVFCQNKSTLGDVVMI